MRLLVVSLLVVSCGGKVADDGTGGGSLPPEPEPGGLVDGSKSVLAAGGARTCAIDKAGVKCWGSPFGRRPVRVEGLASAQQIVAGSTFSCARMANGTVRCFGNNDGGQLGDGTTTTRDAPVRARELTNVVDLAAGAYHGCAVLKDGSVKCWGQNSDGQLGDGTTTNRSISVKVELPSATSVVAGFTHSCALLGDGSVRCWGAGNRGQLGTGTLDRSAKPVAVVGLTGRAVALSAGEDHTCARMEGGALQCWGRNFDGQLGDGGDEVRKSPIMVPLKDVTAIGLGRRHTCAIHGGGQLTCWGFNKSGQLGDGTTNVRRTPGPEILHPTANGVLAVGHDHTCARVLTGETYCWGEGSEGQLGTGNDSNQLTPVTITL